MAHKLFILSFVVVFLTTCSHPTTDQSNMKDTEDPLGKAAWMSCASCHFVPDTAFHFDRVWAEMLQTTS